MYYFIAEKFLMYRGMGMGREVENKKSSYLQINFCRWSWNQLFVPVQKSEKVLVEKRKNWLEKNNTSDY